jgi:soluble cytochrome b562
VPFYISLDPCGVEMDDQQTDPDRERRFLVNRMKIFVEDWSERKFSDDSDLSDFLAELDTLTGHVAELVEHARGGRNDTAREAVERK